MFKKNDHVEVATPFNASPFMGDTGLVTRVHRSGEWVDVHIDNSPETEVVPFRPGELRLIGGVEDGSTTVGSSSRVNRIRRLPTSTA